MKHEIEEFVMPTNLADLQELLQSLWIDIFEKDDISKIDLYNQAAKIYNDKARFGAITIITNFKKQKEMATKKDVAATTKKAKLIDTVMPAADKKKAERAKAKAAEVLETPLVQEEGEIAAPKVKKEAAEPVEKKKTQKELIVELAEDGKSIDEVVEATGIKKTNVQWYFSKLGYSKKPAKEVKASE